MPSATSTNRLRPARAAFAAGLAIATAACGADPSSEAIAVVRLADRLAQAETTTALDGIVPVDALSALPGRVARRTLFATRFDGGRLQLRGPCRVVAGAGRAATDPGLRCGGSGAVVLPAESGQLLRLSTELRAEGDARCRTLEIEVVERGASAAIVVHRLARLVRGDWRTVEHAFFSTPETRALELYFRPGACRGRVAALRLEAVDLDREQELAWMSGQAAAEGHDVRLRRGRLLPEPDPETAAPPRDDAYTVRTALFAPTPSRHVFTLDVPPRARLHFSYGLARESRPGDTARFRVALARPDAEVPLFDDVVAIPDADDWYWRHASIDLSAHAGAGRRLVFETASERGRGYALWGAPMLVPERNPLDPPNVILIAIDTLRADRLSVYGHDEPTSPQLDAFAEDAIRFDHVISAANWTSPAFHALFSGRSPADAKARVPDSDHTLAERFQSAGFVTRAFAYKAILFDQGFDQGFDGFFNVPRVHVRAEDPVDRALAWLEAHERERFFLFMHLDDPHQPFTQPQGHLRERDRARLEALGLGLPLMVHSERIAGCATCSEDGQLRPEAREAARALYDDAIRYADAAIGRFLEHLRARGLYEDAVIAIVSDHGEMLWQHDDLFAHAGPELYDALLHVPLLLKPPRLDPARRGSVVDSQVRLGDLTPTLLELAGIAVREGELSGESLLSLLDGADADDRPALSRGEGAVALRTRRWKYARSRGTGAEPVREQLFDLAADAGETRDRAAELPEVRRERRAALTQALLRSRAHHSILVRGEIRGERASWRIRVQGARPLPELGNLPWRTESSSVLVWEGPASEALPALVQHEPVGDARYTLELRVDGASVLRRSLDHANAVPDAETPVEPRAESPGIIARLIVPAGLSPEATLPTAPVDARNLEALRALGYLDSPGGIRR